MNILVICDQFKKGGLETHIATYADALRRQHTVLVACAQYTPSGLLADEQVFDGFHFSFYDTVAELREDVTRLCAMIREQQIDVLHVHPWFGLYAACYAAAQTGVKLVTTVHGFVSLNYHSNLADQLWMEDILTASVGHAFCVSRMGLDMLRSIHMHRASILPNAVDLRRFRPTQSAQNRRWALVTRLDSDKIETVETLIRMLPELEIDAVDIFGDGACMAQAQALADACPKPVQLMGHSGTLHQRLCGDYFGVIGLGRCAIEGLALGLPVLLAGYGKLCGVVDSARYREAADTNFVTENLPALDADALNAQLRAAYADPDAFCFTDRIRQDFDAETLSQRMVQTIGAAPAGMPMYVGRVYDAICALPDETPVHESREVFAILREILLAQTQDLYLKDQLLQQQLTERERGGAVSELRTELGAVDDRLYTTRTELSAVDDRLHTTRLELGAVDQRLYDTRVEMHAADQMQLHALAAQDEAHRALLQAGTQELRAELAQTRAELQALKAQLDRTTLGHLLRQTVRYKLIQPLKRLLRR